MVRAVGIQQRKNLIYQGRIVVSFQTYAAFDSVEEQKQVTQGTLVGACIPPTVREPLEVCASLLWRKLPIVGIVTQVHTRILGVGSDRQV
jgi:hypothetical protein